MELYKDKITELIYDENINGLIPYLEKFNLLKINHLIYERRIYQNPIQPIIVDWYVRNKRNETCKNLKKYVWSIIYDFLPTSCRYIALEYITKTIRQEYITKNKDFLRKIPLFHSNTEYGKIVMRYMNKNENEYDSYIDEILKFRQMYKKSSRQIKVDWKIQENNDQDNIYEIFSDRVIFDRSYFPVKQGKVEEKISLKSYNDIYV